MNRMENKVAVITGGASGIGKASAIRLAQEGAKITIIDRNAERGKAVIKEITELGGEAIFCQADITNEKQVADAMAQTAKKWGTITTLFANAGIVGTVSPIEQFSTKDWAATIQNNVIGTFETVSQAIPYLKDNGGTITITSSVSGNRRFAQEGFSAYSSSKAAIAAFAKMAAIELAQHKIRVNSICPGTIDTNIFESLQESESVNEINFPFDIPENGIPLKQEAGKSEEVANLFLFLASDEASHLTGTEVYVDSAESLIKG
ncbi:SDR family NAD(P)-dependent oxidoreductase [Niallia taxi]|uniref:SDR family NAD(P)-dependent oxidoreductase n=1 Tax=Niallia taxi TaxID=2499688 RepID=UPI003D2A5AC4